MLELTGRTDLLSGSIVDNATLLFAQTGDASFSGTIGGTGDIIQAGAAATLTLSATNTDAGTITIASGALAFSGDTSLFDGGIVDTTSLIFTQSGDSSFGGVISGTGNVTQAGTGTLTLTGIETYAGSTTIETGALAFSGDTSILSNTVVDDSSLIFTQGSDSTFQGVISGSGDVTQTGAGTLTLSGDNTYANTTIDSGVLALTGDLSGLSGAIVDNAELVFAQSGTTLCR